MKSIQVAETDLQAIQEFVLQIVKRNAPEEVDLVPKITAKVFQEAKTENKPTEFREKMFSFSGSADIMQFLSAALSALLALIVLPYLKKVYEKAIEKAAEQTVDASARQLHQLLEGIKKKPNDPILKKKFDLLIPVNWMEFNKELKITSKDLGLSSAEAQRISKMIVHELQGDRVLLGDMVVFVSKADVQKKQK